MNMTHEQMRALALEALGADAIYDPLRVALANAVLELLAENAKLTKELRDTNIAVEEGFTDTVDEMDKSVGLELDIEELKAQIEKLKRVADAVSSWKARFEMMQRLTGLPIAITIESVSRDIAIEREMYEALAALEEKKDE